MTIKGAYGWALIIGTVIIVDLFAAILNNDETLSSAQYRARRQHPVIVRAAVLATTYHLLFGDDDTWRRLDVYQLPIAAVRRFRGAVTGAHKKAPPRIAPQPARTLLAATRTRLRPQTRGYGKNGRQE